MRSSSTAVPANDDVRPSRSAQRLAAAAVVVVKGLSGYYLSKCRMNKGTNFAFPD